MQVLAHITHNPEDFAGRSPTKTAHKTTQKTSGPQSPE